MTDRPRKKGVKFINSIVKHQNIGWNSCIDAYEAWLGSVEEGLAQTISKELFGEELQDKHCVRNLQIYALTHAIVEYLRGERNEG